MKISLICAFNPNFNTGMYTVDRAANRFFDTIGGAEVVHYTIGEVSKFQDVGAASEGLTYHSLEANFSEALSADFIVFWGDFLHSITYWKSDLIPRELEHGRAATHEEAFDNLCNYLLLENQNEEILKKCIIYGTTVLPDNAKSYESGRYLNSFSRLLENARGVFFREAISASKFSYLRPGQSMYGTDCALVNSHTNKFSLSTKGGPIGIYFGRSERMDRIKFLLVVLYLKVFKGQSFKWVPWFPVKRRDKIDAKLATGVSNITFEGGEAALKTLTECSGIITDVYHVAVNSLAHGIPVVLLGTGVSQDKNTIGSKKKEILFFQYICQQNYIFWESIKILSIPKISTGILESLQDDQTNICIFDNIKKLSKNASMQLRKALTS